MNNILRKKLGVPLEDTNLANKIEAKIETYAPIKLSAEQSESKNTNQAVKTINIGTIKNPNYVIVGSAVGTDSFYSIQNPNVQYFFGRSSYRFVLNGQLYLYDPKLKNLDPYNPYDPIFSSFERLTSFPPRLVQSGRLVGLPQSVSLKSSGSGMGTIFLTTTSGFQSSGVGAFNQYYSGNISMGSIYGQLSEFYRVQDTFQIAAGRTGFMLGRHINHFYYTKNIYYKGTVEYLAFDTSGELGHTGKWVGLSTPFCCSSTDAIALHNRWISQNQIRSLVRVVATAPNQKVDELPTVSWSGIGAPSLRLEFNNVKKRLEAVTTGWLVNRIEMGGKERYLLNNNNSFINGNGYYKIATTRQSHDVNHIYARLTGTTLQVGNVSGHTPNGYFKVTYPHSYVTKSFGALRYDAIIVPELTYGTGSFYGSGRRYANTVNDIIVISTGLNQKKIVYVSPNAASTFTGYWSELAPTNRAAKRYVRNNGVTGFVQRKVYDLNSGSLMSISSRDSLLQVKEDYTLTGSMKFDVDGTTVTMPTAVIYSNVPESMLKTTTPLINNNYYKLYEPIYRPNAFNTGTWNGIIPSGTPFQIEVIRTKSNTYGLNNLQLGIYANQFFGTVTGINGYQVRPYDSNKARLGVFGTFEGRSTVFSTINQSTANYIADNKAYTMAMSKVNGALWDKGLSVQNSKARKIIKLFNGGAWPFSVYSYTKNNVKQYEFGIKTAGGIRTPGGDVIEIDSQSIEEGTTKWTKEF